MPTNNFLPFGTAGGAPVLSQSAYAAITPANGFGPGLLPKESINKALRQANAMAAAMGTFLVAQGQNALDDGNISTLAANIGLAIQSLSGQLPFATTGAPVGFKVGSIIVYFGVYSSDVTNQGNGPTITFPTAFPNACLWAGVTTMNPSGDGTADGWMEVRSWTANQLLTGGDVPGVAFSMGDLRQPRPRIQSR